MSRDRAPLDVLVSPKDFPLTSPVAHIQVTEVKRGLIPVVRVDWSPDVILVVHLAVQVLPVSQAGFSGEDQIAVSESLLVVGAYSRFGESTRKVVVLTAVLTPSCPKPYAEARM